MSVSSSSSGGGSTQPLADVLPWGSPISLIGPASISPNSDMSVPYKCKYTSRTMLITDSLSTDARFLLHTLALQFLSSTAPGTDMSGSVLWISCGSPPVTEKEIAIGLRKGMQHGLGGFQGDSSAASNLGSVNVISVPVELADAAFQSESGTSFSGDSYIKRLHRRIVHWLSYREILSDNGIIDETKLQADNVEQTMKGPNLVIIDGVTTLATLLGDALAQMFVSSVSSSLRTLSEKTSRRRKGDTSEATVEATNLLAIRCLSPDDGGLYNITDLDEFEDTSTSRRTKGQKLRSEYSRLLRLWLGVGSSGGAGNSTMFHLEEQSHCLSLQSQCTTQLLNQSGWYELADTIIDVSPLESGYARDVLGRLSFTTTWNGKGWWGVEDSIAGSSRENKQKCHHGSNCVNYRCDDSGVRILRLRSSK